MVAEAVDIKKIWDISEPGEVQKLKELLEEHKQSHGTTLISYYRKNYKQINYGKLYKEKGQAQNIKDEKTSNIVREGISTLILTLGALKDYLNENDPFVIFVKQKVSIVVKLPPSISINLYICGKSFEDSYLDHINTLTWGLVIVDSKNVIIGLLRDFNLEVLKEYKVNNIPGKTKAGGQSTDRYRETRHNLIQGLCNDVAQNCNELFTKIKISRLFIAGSVPTVDQLCGHAKLKPQLRQISNDKPIGIQYPSLLGLEHLITKIKPMFKAELKKYIQEQIVYRQIQKNLNSLYTLDEIAHFTNYKVKKWYTVYPQKSIFYCSDCACVYFYYDQCEHKKSLVSEHAQQVVLNKASHWGQKLLTTFRGDLFEVLMNDFDGADKEAL